MLPSHIPLLHENRSRKKLNIKIAKIMKTVTAADDASASLHFNEFPSEKKEKTKMVQRLDFFLAVSSTVITIATSSSCSCHSVSGSMKTGGGRLKKYALDGNEKFMSLRFFIEWENGEKFLQPCFYFSHFFTSVIEGGI